MLLYCGLPRNAVYRVSRVDGRECVEGDHKYRRGFRIDDAAKKGRAEVTCAPTKRAGIRTPDARLHRANASRVFRLSGRWEGGSGSVERSDATCVAVSDSGDSRKMFAIFGGGGSAGGGRMSNSSLGDVERLIDV